VVVLAREARRVADSLGVRMVGLRAAPEAPPEGVVGFGDLVLDGDTREVRRGERQLNLTVTEFRLLEFLLRHPRQVLPRGMIFDRVWGFDLAATSNTLTVYIGYLRRKTEAGGEPRLIHTVRGIGYVLRD
jgi:two-component system response regulator MprA